MDLLLYSARESKTARRLSQALHRIQGNLSREHIRNLDVLVRRLRRPSVKPLAVILLAENQTELQELVALECWLEDFRIILIVPDTAHETMTMGHRLRPRYLSYVHKDFSDVASVIARLSKSQQQISDESVPHA